MIVRVNGNSVDGCGADQRIISHHTPSGSVAATVRGFPHSATDRSNISHDAAIGRCRGIDGNGIHPPLGLCVIKAPRTTGHPLRLRTERGKTRSAKGVRISNVELEMLPKWDATWHARMLGRGGAHPSGVKPASRKRQAVVPVLFQPCQTRSLLPCITAGYGHVTGGFAGAPR
jgi:hypothetical protein